MGWERQKAADGCPFEVGLCVFLRTGSGGKCAFVDQAELFAGNAGKRHAFNMEHFGFRN